MKYVVTGSLGHISKPLAILLLKAGHDVTVITSHQDRVKEIETLGAKAAVGSVEDGAFITKSFAGADAVYLMIPPNFAVPNFFEYQKKVAHNYAEAVKANNIRYAVLLSSIGAHLGKGTGPIDGVSYLEQQLGAINDVNVKSLRPSYFYMNFFAQLALLKHANILGSNFGGEEKLVLTDTNDIADAAAAELLSLSFKGKSHMYIASDERLTSDIAAILGNAAGKPNTPWVPFSDEDTKNAMVQAGLSQDMAERYTTMGKAIRDGVLQEDYWKNRPATLGKVKLEDFAKVFGAAYQNS